MQLGSWRFSTAFAATAALVTACVGGNVAAGASSDTASQGGSVTVAYHTEPTSLDVVGFNDYVAAIAHGTRATAIYDALVVIDSVTGELTPRIAESLETVDGVTYTLTLRDGVEFSDGTPYDAAAVQFNWERLQDPDVSAPTATWANMMSSFEVVDPLTLQFDVSPATTRFGWVIAQYLTAIGSPTAIEELGGAFAERPVGAGPFVVDEWVRDSHITLVRNENYWQAGKPYLDELTMRFVPDEQQRLQAVGVGEIDIAQTPNVQIISQAEDQGLDVHVWQSGSGRWLALNAAKPPFDDPVAVEAIRHAIDFETFVSNSEGDSGIVARTLFLETNPLFDEAGTFPDYDPVRAQELLDQYEAEHGEPLRFAISVAEAIRQSGETLQALLSVYTHLEVEVQIRPTSEHLDFARSDQFDSLFGVGNFVGDPFPVLHFALTSDLPQNFSNISIPELDAALRTAATASTDAERTSAYQEVQRIVAQESPLVMLSRIQYALYYQGDAIANLQVFNDFVPDWAELQEA